MPGGAFPPRENVAAARSHWHGRLRTGSRSLSKQRTAPERDARRRWPTPSPAIVLSCLGHFTWWAPHLIGSRRTTFCHRRRFPNILRRPGPLSFKADKLMDRRVKERLVGASILVVLIVLIVPELLSGPARGPMTPLLPGSTPEPTRTVTVDLATSKTP